jgi:hypothetical protein
MAPQAEITKGMLQARSNWLNRVFRAAAPAPKATKIAGML